MPEIFNDITALALLAFVLYLVWIATNKAMATISRHLERTADSIAECNEKLSSIQESLNSLSEYVQLLDAVSTLREGGD